MKKKTAKQLDVEISAALAGHPRLLRAHRANQAMHRSGRSHHVTKGTKATKMPDPKKTLKEIALFAFPHYKGRKIRLEEAGSVERQVEGGGTFYDDRLVDLLREKHVLFVEPPHAFRGTGRKRTEIPFGFVYVSQGRFQGHDTGITISIPPLDSAAMSVAVDAMLAAGGKVTPTVLTVIEGAIGTGASLHRDAYVALVAQRANELIAGESSSAYG